MSQHRPTILEPPAGDPYCFRVRYWDHVGRKRQQSFRGVDEKSGRAALKRAQAFCDDLIGKQQRGERTSSSKMTVEELWDRWWEVIVLGPKIAAGTANGSYGPSGEHRILPYLGQAPISTIDHETLEGFISWMAKRDYGPQTIRNTFAALGSMFTAAVKWKLLPANPVRGMDLPTVPDADRQAYEPRVVYEIAAGMRFDRDRAMVVFAAFSGLRKGDVYAMEWRNIDTGPVELPDGYEPSMRVFRKKSQKWTTVPLLEPARLALIWWHAITPFPNGLVFTSEKGTSLAKQSSAWYRRCWRPGTAAAGMVRCANAACQLQVPSDEHTGRRLAVDPKRGAQARARWEQRKALGRRTSGPEPVVPWACPACGEREVVGPVFHELRHSFASLAVAATGDASQVAEWGGWAGTQMLERRYKHQLDRGRKRAVAMVNDLAREWTE